jgi:hypothetical protein
MERIRNTNMVSARSISLFTITSLLSLLLLFHLLGGTEISKEVQVLNNTTNFASNNNYTSKPSVRRELTFQTLD